MPTEVRAKQSSLIGVWAVTGLFVLGFFWGPVGFWTGPILPVWFVGTQRVRRGFLWMVGFGFLPDLLFHWRQVPLTGLSPALTHVAWMLAATVLGTLPFTFHRLVSPRLPGLLATLPFPLAAAAIGLLAAVLPAAAGLHTVGLGRLCVLWFAALVVWLWTRESKATAWVAGAGVVAGLASALAQRAGVVHLPQIPVTESSLAWACAALAALLAVYAAVAGARRTRWADRAEALARLQSPVTREPLSLQQEHGREFLSSASGERFPIANGIPSFLQPEDLTGDNGKYNHLYETIGGFYDDTQRVACALRGLDRDSYFLNYMSLLEVKPGDSVLETSVGTGLNFRYLPPGVKLSGLDLSPEMLGACQANMGRWGMEADLYLGNAESLPFADSSFDVVFHVGGISFFNDKGKAIREMIRVAKPGSLLLIEDETEEYAKSTYEKIPITSSYYKNRESAISVPIDLVPAEMEQIKLQMLKDGKFYAITFRKPAEVRGMESPRAAELVAP